MSRPLYAAAVVVSFLMFASSAFATTQTSRSGDVSATFTFHGKWPQYSDERLTIVRDGTTAYNAPVTSSWCGGTCAPGAGEPKRLSVRVVDLEHNGEPDVVLSLYSGGAHCCSIDEVFWFDQSTGTYHETARDFGDPGANIVDFRGHDDFVTADDSFAYAFTDYAASGLPIEILSFEGDRFSNVTRSWPVLIEKNANEWMAAFNSMASSGYKDSVGVIAAWAADEALLGRERAADRFLSQQAKAGHLNSALLPHQGGEKFIAALDRLLRKDGYLPRQSNTGLHPLSTSTAIPACSTADLSAQIEQGSPGAGQRYAMLVLTNTSHESCHTYGYVGMQLLNRQGGALATDVVRDHTLKAQRIVLAPGAQTYAQLHWSVVPGTGDSGAPCFSAPARVEITAPDAYTHVTIRWAGGTVCEHGRIDVQPLSLGGCGGYMKDLRAHDFSLPPADRVRL
jgi:hypothetical protein